MQKRIPVVLIIIFSILALWSLWSSKYLPAFHDQYQAERISEMTGAIAFGQLPPRYVQNLGYGYGYPLFNYYAPLPYYLGSLIYLLGVDLILATKLMISVGFVLAGANMYIVTRRWTGPISSAFASALYLFAPYHAVQLYVRGAIGELFAYAFLPYVLLGLLTLYRAESKRHDLWLSIFGITGLYLSHTITLYMTALIIFTFTLPWIAIKLKKPKALTTWKHFLLWLLIPILLTTYFWLPAFGELGATKLEVNTGNAVNFREHFITLAQMWSSPWGYAGSALGVAADGMSFMVGKSAIILTLISLIVFFSITLSKTKLRVHTHNTPIIITGLILLLSLFLTNSISSWLWEIVPMMNLIQFPWRWLSFLALTTAFLSGLGVHLLLALVRPPELVKVQLLAQLLFTALLLQLLTGSTSQIKFFRAQSYYQKDHHEILQKTHLIGEVSAVSDEYLYRGLLSTTDLVPSDSFTASCSKPCRILSDLQTPDRYEVTVSASGPSLFIIHKSNFPGFKAFIDQKEVALREFSGMLAVDLPQKGTYHVTFQLYDTLLRALGNILSVATILGITIYFLKASKKNI